MGSSPPVPKPGQRRFLGPGRTRAAIEGVGRDQPQLGSENGFGNGRKKEGRSSYADLPRKNCITLLRKIKRHLDELAAWRFALSPLRSLVARPVADSFLSNPFLDRDGHSRVFLGHPDGPRTHFHRSFIRVPSQDHRQSAAVRPQDRR